MLAQAIVMTYFGVTLALSFVIIPLMIGWWSIPLSILLIAAAVYYVYDSGTTIKEDVIAGKLSLGK